MERDKINQRIEIKCTQEFKRNVQKRIKQLNIKQSDYIRMLINEDLKKMKDDKND
ncbi:hypothetical protein [Clostridium sp.]|uniref:hypothetical protein n=1 Tax=Clostridium sp. TaxID=1506 RepID=UPI0039967205